MTPEETIATHAAQIRDLRNSNTRRSVTIMVLSVLLGARMLWSILGFAEREGVSQAFRSGYAYGLTWRQSAFAPPSPEAAEHITNGDIWDGERWHSSDAR